MNSSSAVGFHIPTTLPSLPPSPLSKNSLCVASTRRMHNTKINLHKDLSGVKIASDDCFGAKQASLAIQLGAILAAIEYPAVAMTGVNYEPELGSVVIQLGIVAVFYLLVIPPIIMNWLRVRWYRRNLLEMYLQFMCVFLFFPGILVWAPFLNFRKFPRDPDMKYPWDKPKDPSKIKNAYLKYPFAQPEDYD